jgi:hypothetical protein
VAGEFILQRRHGAGVALRGKNDFGFHRLRT